MKLENITISSIHVTCRGGAELSECIRQALLLALEWEETVLLRHNCRDYCRDYIVDFKAIVDNIYQQHL